MGGLDKRALAGEKRALAAPVLHLVLQDEHVWNRFRRAGCLYYPAPSMILQASHYKILLQAAIDHFKACMTDIYLLI